MADTDTWTTVRVTMRAQAKGEDALRADGERLEALAALLADRDDVGGVENRDPFTLARGPDFVAVAQPELIAYTTPDQGAEVAEGVRALAQMLGMEIDTEVDDHQGDAWRDAWKRHYRTLRFAGLQIRPSWIPREPDDPTREVVLDPGRAFGTGLHESTRLCLSALVELAEPDDHSPSEGAFDTVLDLGCGSGILGLASARLFPGARLILLDHDPEAVETSRENAAANGLTGAAEFGVVDLLGDRPSLPTLSGRALVLANIRPEVLIPAADAIARSVPGGGTLLLSGILREEADAVRRAYADRGLRARPARDDGDWTALTYVRER